jgi:toxin ParE1/3/4
VRIGNYTQRTWGGVQKRKYLNALKAAFKALGDNPALGSPRDDISPGLRALTVEKHLIFYRDQKGDALIIIRVLHHSMEPAWRLPQTNP